MIGALLERAIPRLLLDELEALERVRLVVKRRPDLEDLARGILPTQPAAFWGADGRGEVLLFTDVLVRGPFALKRVELALRHELRHALGEDEGEVLRHGLDLRPLESLEREPGEVSALELEAINEEWTRCW